MELVNLVDFVRSTRFFEKMSGKYFQIVSDYDFGKFQNFIKIDGFGDFQKINKDKKTLLILDKLLHINIDFLMDMVDLTILDLNFGMDSLRYKIGFSNTDFSCFMKKNVNIYEPIDSKSLINILALDEKKYIRISNVDLIENLRDTKRYEDIFDFGDMGYDGTDIVVLTTASLLSEVVMILSSLKNYNISLSLLVLNKLNLDIHKKMLPSKNLVFILDLDKDLSYEGFICNQLKGYNIKFVYPNYSKRICCILDEYKYENYCFDAQFLLDTILKR